MGHVDEAMFLPETGERMVPEQSDCNILWEHLYRYKFATEFVSGRRVLDIACGEGYGTSALGAAGAKSVIGIDVSQEACQYAHRKYGIDARVGDAAAIPLPDRSIDLVVSFETVEHVPDPETFIRECSRVLVPGGSLIISTPNVDTYNDQPGAHHNPFHCSEMTTAEFRAVIAKCFQSIRLYYQVAVSAPFFSLSGILSRRGYWRKLRGYHRLIASRSPSADMAREQLARSRPIDEILRKDSWIERLLNPYAVRPQKQNSAVRPLYSVVVACNPIRS
jgi:SAM-dependent methyltransferase